jgi:ribosomal RNA assembly protein
MTEMVKIPAERVKVLVGENGRAKAMIEKMCNVRLIIEDEGDVDVEGEATDVFFAKDIVKAIGRGFAPKDALRLADQDYNLYIIPLKAIVSSEKAMTRLKGRVIGRDGRAKSDIESATQSVISVYGSTIGIISRIDTMGYARESVGMLLEGATHTALQTYLSKARREIMDNRLRGKTAATETNGP